MTPQADAHVFVLWGVVPAKKDKYTPKRGGMFIGSELRAQLNDLEMQIPGEVRDLQLEDPDISIWISSKSSRRDKDSILTTILDLLVKCGTIPDDNLEHCNGRIILEPAEIGGEDSVRVCIYPK